MTVQTTSSKAGPFFGNGATLVWSSGFRIDQPADLWVVYTDPTGVETQLDATLYTVTGFGDPDGVSVTYPISGTPISATEKITLLRVVDYDQQTSITNQGGFYPQVIERALDRIVYQTQQIAEKLTRSVFAPIGSGIVNMVFPAPVSGKFLRGNSDNTGFENADLIASGMIGIPVPLTQGGTGADNATEALIHLGLGEYQGRNRIINGGMDVAQRGTSFVSVPAGPVYGLDRWNVTNQSAGKVTMTQQPDAPNIGEFSSSLRVEVTTADAAIAAGDEMHLRQVIEGYNVSDLVGRDFTLSFWVRSAKTGPHCVSFRSMGVAAPDRSYVVEYAITAANTWQKVSVTVPGGLDISSGTWNFREDVGLQVSWTLASGITYKTDPGLWQNGNYISTANQVNLLDTVGNIFALTGVQLEAGFVASQFEHRLFGAELALCQRYYEKSFPYTTTPAAGTTSVGATTWSQAAGPSALDNGNFIVFKVVKRVTPTMLTYNPAVAGLSTAHNYTATAECVTSLLAASETGIGINVTTPANSNAGYLTAIHWTANAEL